MVKKRASKNGPAFSDTLLKGGKCLWLGFHRNSNDYLTLPITNDFFQKRALNGDIGTINQAGLHGAEVEFSVENAKGFSRLNISVEELLPMTIQQVDTLRESISNIQGETTTMNTQTKVETQKGYECTEQGCSFSSPSPQGLGTHRVKSHNLVSRSQKRSGGRRIPFTNTDSQVSKPVSTTTTKKTNSTLIYVEPTSFNENWKAKHDAIMKRYNRLCTKHDTVMKALKKIVNS